MEDALNLSGDDQSNTARQFGKEINKSQGDIADAHKRSRLDRSLGKVPFVGISAKADASWKSTVEHDKAGGKARTARGSRIAEALRPSGRKRKGSLRQGLLGKNMLRRGPLEDQRTSTAKATLNTNMAETTSEEETTPRPFGYENASRNSTSDSGWAPTAAGPSLSASTTRSSSYELDEPNPDVLASALTSSVVPYASTTDDDEAISALRPSASNGSSYNTDQLHAANAMQFIRRRTNRVTQRTSLSTVQSPTDVTLDEEWDYSETEWWGWIILIGTWIVFVVGMGSCLGVWSWAWDVGETPYAPPELEDDPTLPITGYYPALMVCTAVMAWVWVVVAWVGMKYFRHSKMVSDDG